MKKKQVIVPIKTNSKKKADSIDKSDQKGSKIYLLGILLISFLAFLPVLYNGFVNWDDDQYIQENLLIQSFNLKEIFTGYFMGNYHPLTMLILALEFKLFGMAPTGYHSISLLLHLLNTILVYKLVILLSDKKYVALITCLLFGIHPIHVESVAWVSELKDLLYAFFFLLSLIYYLKYIKLGNKKFYIYSLILFLSAILSKAMAASLPLVLLLIDYFMGRKINMKLITDKIPFFLIACFFGVVAIAAQKTSGSIADDAFFSLTHRILFACYGFVNYFIKIIFPFQLSAFYPYPVKVGSEISSIYYLYPFLVIGFLAFVVYSIRFSRKLVFAIGFFTATIILVLQLIPVGAAVMADRYAYIPSIGLFYLAGEGINLLWSKKSKFFTSILLSALIIFFSIKTYTRCEVWKSGMSLWNDVISQYQNVSLAYNSRGVLFDNENKFNEAFSDYSKAIELNPQYDKAYNNRGNLLMKGNKFNEAKFDYNKSIVLEPNFFGAYKNRAHLYESINNPDSAFIDYSKAISLDSTVAEIYLYRGIQLQKLNRNDEALKDFSSALRLSPSYIEAYLNRATLLQNENKFDEALKDYNVAARLKPDNPKIYYNRGNLFGMQNKYADAINDFSLAIKIKSDYALAYFGRGITECNAGNKKAGCSDLQNAIKLGFQPAVGAFNNYCQ